MPTCLLCCVDAARLPRIFRLRCALLHCQLVLLQVQAACMIMLLVGSCVHACVRAHLQLTIAHVEVCEELGRRRRLDPKVAGRTRCRAARLNHHRWKAPVAGAYMCVHACARMWRARMWRAWAGMYLVPTGLIARTRNWYSTRPRSESINASCSTEPSSSSRVPAVTHHEANEGTSRRRRPAQQIRWHIGHRRMSAIDHGPIELCGAIDPLTH